MRGLSSFWRWLTEMPRSVRGIRGRYAILAVGFLVLAVIGMLADDTLVVIVALVVAAAVGALAIAAPWLAQILSSRVEPRNEGGLHGR